MNTSHQPKITIITPSFNQAEFLERTLQSVQRQGYDNMEHIVVDGGSTDGTLEVLRKYPHVKWISEPDRGQADALRKGFEMAGGQILGWVNSDDYYEPGIFHEVAAHFEDPQVSWVVGNLSYLFDETQEIVADRSPRITLQGLLRNPDIVRQQPTFFRKSLLQRVGGCNPEFFMVMDFDLWVRFARLGAPKMVNRRWAYFRIHAKQKSTRRNVLRQSAELSRILRREGAPAVRILDLQLRRRLLYWKLSLKAWLQQAGLLSSKYAARPMRIRARQGS